MGATVDYLNQIQRGDVSIHAPVMGATTVRQTTGVAVYVSIHAPVMGATCRSDP